MSFQTILQSIVDECGGGLSAALMGLDGIPIEQVRVSGQIDREDPLRGDVTNAGVEFGRIIGDMTKASDFLRTGRFEEAVVSLEQVRLIFRSVSDDLMLVLALRPDGNLGKARYLIRRDLVALRDEL
jgi:predicted regulator of Ras-like GTPase activity (Roadblock/LC7/MglB family)